MNARMDEEQLEPAAEASEEARAKPQAPSQVATPDYRELANFIQDIVDTWAHDHAPTDKGRKHKIEARALKVIIPQLQLRLQRI